MPRQRDGRVVAGLGQLAGYNAGWFRADVLAGVTVTAYLVPQCLAYSSLAGVAPVAGLWTAVAAMLVYALLGTSRQLSLGPDAATAVMVAAAVAPLAGGNPARYAMLAAGLALMIGILCLGAFVLRLGFVADLLSQPILVGYMAGVALVMVASQLGTITGVSLSAPDSLGRIGELAGRLGEIQPVTLGLGACVVAFLLALRRVVPLAPGTLIAVVGAAAIVAAFGLESRGVTLVGAVPRGLPVPSLPALQVGDLTALIGSAAAITFVAYTNVALTGRAFAARGGETIDPNREFLALGVANVATGLGGGFAVTASGSRTALMDAMRARSQVASVVAAISVVIVVLLLPGLIGLIPNAALGGIVVYAALRMINVKGLRRLARFRRSELGLALAAVAGVLVFGVLAGILVAMALSVAELFARVARPPAAVLGRVPGLAGLHNIEDYPDAVVIPGLLVFRYDAPLCFANAQDFRTHALAAIDAQTAVAIEGQAAVAIDAQTAVAIEGQAPVAIDAQTAVAIEGQAAPVEWFLLNAEAIVELDVTSADALHELAADLAARGITFAMARVKQTLRAQLVRGGLLGVIDEARIYPTLPVAVEAFERRADLG